MPDPLSVASGVTGFLSLGIQIVQSLVEFYSTYKSRAQDLAKMSAKLESLLAILKCLDINSTPLEAMRLIHFEKKTLQALEQEVACMRDNLSLALDVLQVRNYNNIEHQVGEMKLLFERFNANQLSSEIEEWLSAPDSRTDHEAAHAKYHTNTRLWFLQDHRLLGWLSGEDSFLWIHGFSGCGKSVLCSMVVQHVIQANRNHRGIGVAFFYFRFDDPLKGTVLGMLSALLLQLSSQVENGQRVLEHLYKSYKPRKPVPAGLLGSLRSTLAKFRGSFIFLDGLDEATNSSERSHLLGTIQKMREWNMPNFHLFVTSRDEYDIRQSLQSSDNQNISLKNFENDKDIAKFVSYKLRTETCLQKWHHRHTEIRDTLLEKSQGVFQYVELQLAALAKARIQNQVDECLHSLPRDLGESYERTLHRIEDLYVEDVRRLLTTLCVSARPLTMDELIGALAVNLSDPPYLDYDGRSYRPVDLIEICRGLIEVVTSKKIYGEPVVFARVAHFSVQAYLQSDQILHHNARRFAVRMKHAHMELAQVCLIYIMDSALFSQMSSTEIIPSKETTIRFPFAEYAAEQWYYHYRQLTDGKVHMNDLVLKLFQNSEFFLTWVNLHDPDDDACLMNFRPWSLDTFGSPIYYCAFLGLDDILKALIEGERDHRRPGAFLDKTNGCYGSALQAASFKGHERVVQLLLEKGADPYALGGKFGSALQAASFAGHDKVVQILLENSMDFHAHGVVISNALHTASSEGHGKIVKLLLDKGADINAQSQNLNALLAASARGHDSLVRMLLQKGANVNTQVGRTGSALLAASFEGHGKIVDCLIRNGANVNAQGGNFGNALQAASVNGHDIIVNCLIRNGADVNAQGGKLGNALQAASANGYDIIVNCLIRNGADVNAQGGKLGNALQAASVNGHEKVVQTLLQNKVDVNFQGGEYGNVLQAASYSGLTSLVLEVLATGASVNSRNGFFGSALQAASFEGHGEIVQILLENRADINIQGGEYETALQAASYGGHIEIVRILLEKGADVNLQGGQYGNALQAASCGGNSQVVQMLLAKGADVNCQGGPYGNALQAALCEECWETDSILTIVTSLVENGANVNARSRTYGSALQAACIMGDEHVVQMLLDKGADVNAPRGINGNALEIAIFHDHKNIAEKLMMRGARDQDAT
ncbi:hypothetical protein N7448_008631 [Penicillium atrosanguineum]|nr:hypothetical protein N7448_008631 [Penicillium atrosanguineum]